MTWTCESCGKLTDGRNGLDDAMDCMCERCWTCGERVACCTCDDEANG
jgi:hypothetical protein